MKPKLLLIFLLATVNVIISGRRTFAGGPYACDPSDPNTKTYRFCHPDLGFDARLDDLLARFTLDEKLSLLGNTAPPIPRLGIPAYQWWAEALHGVSGYGRGVSFDGKIKGATSFPQVILSAATFNPSLWYRIGQAIGREGRAMYNEGQAKGVAFWTPNVNIFRDPRWGRGQETPGEDPVTASRYAVAYVRGLQGDTFHGGKQGSSRLLASACCKHYTAYDLENWNGLNRKSFDAKVTPQDLADTYQPPFKSCIEKAGATGLMCAYNSVNGIPACADYNLLTKVARHDWHFNGYIVSDCDAVSTVYDDHKYVNTPEDAVAGVLKAGLDVNCGDFLTNYTKSALDQNKVAISDVDRALRNLFSVRMRLGLFDVDSNSTDLGKLGADQVCTQENQQLALTAAQRGIVLLKNGDGRLPLSKVQTSALAVIGPNAANGYALLGNYEGLPCKSVPILLALQSYVQNILFQEGCENVSCINPNIEASVSAAGQAEDVVLVMGLDQSQECEDRDRVVLTLPGQQESLIKAVAAAAKKPVVLVLLSGGPVDVSFARDDPKVGSIIWAGYPGEAGGIALAQILFGEQSPGGKLPMTWYPNDFTKVSMSDMRMRPDPSSGYPGRSYRFYNGPKVFDFGYGLSYTTHSYEFHASTPTTLELTNLLNPSQIQETEYGSKYVSISNIDTPQCERTKFTTKIRIKNTGNIPSDHPVLLFIRHGRTSNVRGSPLKQLVGFETVSLNANEKTEIDFVLSLCEHLSSMDEYGLRVIEGGEKFLMVGDAEYPVNIKL